MGRRHIITAALLVAFGALGASACSADDDDSGGASLDAPAITGNGETDAGSGGGSRVADDDADAAPAAVGAPGQVDTTGRALAIEAGVRIGVPDIRSAADDTLATIRRNGATVHTADVSIGTERDDGTVDGGGFFRVRVAPDRLDALIADLDATVGPVTGRTQDTADVTDQLVDLDIRIGVERDVIARFRALLLDATEFEDVVAIERVIGERTITLEQLLASQRALEDRVAEATLTIELFHTPTPVAEEPVADDGIGDAFAAGWDAFVGALFAIGFVLAVAAPFLLTSLLVLGVVWFAGRRVAHRRPPRATTDRRDTAVTPDDEELAAPTRDG